MAVQAGRLVAATPLNDAGRPRRIGYLDATRGLAALGVLVTHIVQFSGPFPWLNHSPLRLFVNGRCFVVYFFVLSGFVLTYGLVVGDQPDRPGVFILRRFARIYLPYAVAGLLGFAVVAAWSGAAPVGDILAYLALLGTTDGTRINPPSWSLVYELRISCLLPLIVWSCVRAPRGTLAGFALLFVAVELAILALHLGQFPYGVNTPVGALLATARFAVCFFVGTWLALAPPAAPLPGWATVALLVVAALLMSVLLDQTSLAGSAILLVVVLRSPPLQQALETPVLRWLGRISFSLYLTHFMVLEAVYTLLGTRAPLAAPVIAAALSLAAAALFFSAVEAPAMALSKRLKQASQRPGPA